MVQKTLKSLLYTNRNKLARGAAKTLTDGLGDINLKGTAKTLNSDDRVGGLYKLEVKSIVIESRDTKASIATRGQTEIGVFTIGNIGTFTKIFGDIIKSSVVR